MEDKIPVPGDACPLSRAETEPLKQPQPLDKSVPPVEAAAATASHNRRRKRLRSSLRLQLVPMVLFSVMVGFGLATYLVFPDRGPVPAPSALYLTLIQDQPASDLYIAVTPPHTYSPAAHTFW